MALGDGPRAEGKGRTIKRILEDGEPTMSEGEAVGRGELDRWQKGRRAVEAMKCSVASTHDARATDESASSTFAAMFAQGN